MLYHSFDVSATPAADLEVFLFSELFYSIVLEMTLADQQHQRRQYYPQSTCYIYVLDI